MTGLADGCMQHWGEGKGIRLLAVDNEVHGKVSQEEGGICQGTQGHSRSLSVVRREGRESLGQSLSWGFHGKSQAGKANSLALTRGAIPANAGL